LLFKCISAIGSLNSLKNVQSKSRQHQKGD